MTSRQYEHIGRAMMLAAALARGVEGMRDVRDSLFKEINSLVGAEAAKEIDNLIMVDYTPSFRLGFVLNEITEAIEKVQPKEVAK